MTFRSTSITGAGDDYELAGDLTIAGVTKPVTFDVEFNGTEVFPGDQTTHAGFTATGQIRRSDFGIDFGIIARRREADARRQDQDRARPPVRRSSGVGGRQGQAEVVREPFHVVPVVGLRRVAEVVRELHLGGEASHRGPADGALDEALGGVRAVAAVRECAHLPANARASNVTGCTSTCSPVDVRSTRRVGRWSSATT